MIHSFYYYVADNQSTSTSGLKLDTAMRWDEASNGTAHDLAINAF
jgi:hypothetical protein